MSGSVLQSLAAAPVGRREFSVDPAQRVAPGQASVGPATSHFVPLDTTDPTALMMLRAGIGQTMPETSRLYGMATDAAGFSGGIRAFHGSPHDFARFRMDRIGTGEGAQAYGHGLYFAGNEDVARTYRDALSPRTAAEAAAQELAESHGRTWGGMGAYERQSYIDEALRSGLQSSRQPRGRMYEVNLNVDPNRLLDWDAPLSAQGREAQRSLMNLPQAHRFSPDWNGAQLYESAALVPGATRDSAAAASALREAGIPGIRYLDGGSRAAGDGTRNYVMFDDSLIEIMRKYGLAGLGLGGSLAAAAAPPE